MPTKPHRPPHAEYKIKELIKMGHYDDAQQCTDENVTFYRDKIGDQQSLFLEAQCGKMGVQPTHQNKLLACRGEKRVIVNQTEGV